MWQVDYEPSVNKALKKLQKCEAKISKRILTLIEEFKYTDDPRGHPNAMKIVGFDNRYRWRVGDYRIIGDVFDDRVVIIIIKIAHRKDVYKKH